MAFGRKKSPRAGKRNELAKLDATPPWEARERQEPAATTGPFDVRDAPVDEVPRADLGALRIPVATGLELQVEVNEEDQQIIAASLVSPVGSMQLMLFAAPRNEGIWDEVRAEMAEQLTEQRNKPVEGAGPFGPELSASLSDGARGRMPVRFLGIDGPRWLLRATLVGAAADPGHAEVFEQALRQVVVVRGDAPLPVREPVPIVLPKDVETPDEPADG
ncbi:MAG TPA: DUF3710 domain-containing protein [Jatrophihabitans sp.]